MKSRITIEVDFDNGNRPVIQIIRKESTDVRDGLVAAFIQSLGHKSTWLRVDCVQDERPTGIFDDQAFQRWRISAIKPEDLHLEASQMEESAKAV